MREELPAHRLQRYKAPIAPARKIARSDEIQPTFALPPAPFQSISAASVYWIVAELWSIRIYGGKHGKSVTTCSARVRWPLRMAARASLIEGDRHRGGVASRPLNRHLLTLAFSAVSLSII